MTLGQLTSKGGEYYRASNLVKPKLYAPQIYRPILLPKSRDVEAKHLKYSGKGRELSSNP